MPADFFPAERGAPGRSASILRFFTRFPRTARRSRRGARRSIGFEADNPGEKSGLTLQKSDEAR